ncbi:MAG: chromate efflux transporter [Rhodobacteraceae bacterium]|jgi:chromate transporter|nr:chromate efflux transporter [Paracoccaceae bacterium]MBL6790323.1 chromate efflux transporter [Paracoccaceae bacterium]MBL6860839.1 chromate efflux transporter [Paracoccaceae bacterium]
MAVSATDEAKISTASKSARLRDIFWVFVKIGLLSFGGPAGQIALMHRILVDEKEWLDEQSFLNALNFCMLLPGPEAMQLATFAGWRLRGISGGLIAGGLFVLPGAAVMLILSISYVAFSGTSMLSGIFLGVKAAILVVVVQALITLSRRALTQTQHYVISGAAFVGLFFFNLSYPVIVIASGVYGAFFLSAYHKGPQMLSPEGAQIPQLSAFSFGRFAITLGVGLCLWLCPLVIVFWGIGVPFLAELGWFFSKLALVTFGGAYAVLAYMAQDVVGAYGWLNPAQVLDGLGLAETTPGPLILVTQFVAFVAGFQQGGYALALIAVSLGLWVTFVPCFLWIFLGAPYVQRLSSQPRLWGALGAVTAAVVGVILNLSVWFALQVSFETVLELRMGLLTFWVPQLVSVDLRVIVIATLSAILIWRFKLALGWVLMGAAGVGLLFDLLF